MPLLNRLLRAGETKLVKRLAKYAQVIDELEPETQALTDAELREAGPPFDTLGLVNQIGKEVLSKMNIVSGTLELSAEISF